MNNALTPDQIRNWFAHATDEHIKEFMTEGWSDIIWDLEADDFFGTEGFDKRFA